MGDAALARAIGLALTGRELELSSPLALSAELAGLGYSPEVLATVRAERQERREPWPFPVPLEARRALGFARFDAALAEARRALGLTGLTPSASARRPLDPDERRLVQDRPPHW
ncbi:hypothetical protein [Tessaracoccus sp. G1721]